MFFYGVIIGISIRNFFKHDKRIHIIIVVYIRNRLVKLRFNFDFDLPAAVTAAFGVTCR